MNNNSQNPNHVIKDDKKWDKQQNEFILLQERKS